MAQLVEQLQVFIATKILSPFSIPTVNSEDAAAMEQVNLTVASPVLIGDQVDFAHCHEVVSLKRF